MAEVVNLRDAQRAEKERKRGGGGGGGDDREGPPPAPMPAECPVSPLGSFGGRYWFFAENGEKREISARDMGSAPIIVSLFSGKIEWLKSAFPAFDREGAQIDWFNVRRAGAWLVAQCVEAGLYDPMMSERGVGVWRVGEGLAVHSGKTVRFFGGAEADRDRPAGFTLAGALWPRQPSAPLPAAPARPEEARWLLGLFQRWEFERSGEAGIMFGLWAAGLLGSAIGWRPHGLIVGPPGSGKSTLLELYAAASPLAFFSNDFTEAGLRQSLSGRAAPLILDEAEGDLDGANKMTKVVELLRRSSGGAGARTVKGSPGGAAQSFTVTSAALLGAILPPTLLPQDASRITRLDLWPANKGSAPLPSAAEIARVGEIAAALWGRALAGLDRFRDNLAAIRAAILARGCAPRLADQLGTILAAREAMLSDAPADAEAAVASAAWLLPTVEEASEEGGPRACLAHLLGSPSDWSRHGERPSIGALVREALTVETPADALRVLGEHGLRLGRFPLDAATGAPVLYVANKHPRLSRIYEGTAWGGGRWRDDLRHLPLASSPGPVAIGAIPRVRCTMLPADLLPGFKRRSGEAEEDIAM